MHDSSDTDVKIALATHNERLKVIEKFIENFPDAMEAKMVKFEASIAKSLDTHHVKLADEYEKRQSVVEKQLQKYGKYETWGKGVIATFLFLGGGLAWLVDRFWKG
jgi:hypothetical protein